MASLRDVPWYWLSVGVLAALVLTAACSDDDGDSSTSTSTPTTSRTATSGDGGSGGDSPGGGTPSAAVRMALDQDIGSEAAESDIQPIDIDVHPDGEGLPDGSGTVSRGADVYAARCAACHGQDGRNPTVGPQLVSEPGPWQPGMPKTIGSYWPYATTLYDYIHRAMPFNEPGSLSADEVYAVVAWLLNQNQIVPDDAEMNRDTLPAVEMPNRDNFEACWPDACRPDVE
ncbi:MAG: c-type cytochrome [Dehalococcoidia bacterium]